MAHVDLHLHTTFSDGTLTPEALVEAAAARDVTLIAITDHDEIGGIAPAQAVGPSRGVQVLSGVEINTEVGRNDVHILGYGFSIESSVMREGLRALREARLERALVMLQRLAHLGYPLEIDRVMAIAGQGSIGRPHLARALVEAGYVPDQSAAFDRLLGNRKPAYVPRKPYTPEQAIMMIHQAGGIASLAHPAKLGDPPGMIRRLRQGGLDALEVYHSDHLFRATERMRLLAQRYGLVMTGGTDSHGPVGGSHTTEVGSVDVPDSVGTELLALLERK
ncbi:MAG: PHP domain-containing protein [Armatimonadota bacterium]